MSTTVEFYKIYFYEKAENDLEGNAITMIDCFKKLTFKTHTFIDNYDRDFYKFKEIDNKYIGGIFRKVRTGEPIKVGKTGTDGWDVSMRDDEGKFETNHLVYFPDKNIIAYIRNHHGNYYKRLENCLSDAFSTRVELAPLLTKGSLESILKGREIVKLVTSVPVKPELIPKYDQDWSDETMRALSKSQADVVKIEVDISTRRKTHGVISNGLSAAKNFLSYGATKAKVQVENIDGKTDWVDLIADKIEYKFKDYKYSKETLPDASIYEKIIKAYLDKKDEIDEAY